MKCATTNGPHVTLVFVHLRSTHINLHANDLWKSLLTLTLLGNLSFIDFITQICVNHCHMMSKIFVLSYMLKTQGMLIQKSWNLISFLVSWKLVCAKQHHNTIAMVLCSHSQKSYIYFITKSFEIWNKCEFTTNFSLPKVPVINVNLVVLYFGTTNQKVDLLTDLFSVYSFLACRSVPKNASVFGSAWLCFWLYALQLRLRSISDVNSVLWII